MGREGPRRKGFTDESERERESVGGGGSVCERARAHLRACMRAYAKTRVRAYALAHEHRYKT